MSEPIIKVEHLSKKYILRHENAERYTALRDVITNKVKGVFNSKPSGGQQSKEEFWALNDVSFEIQQGERVGIIGRNGAGKSTLLKILSRIVAPTKGRITIDGRAASLLEVGTGFHPELSGRENIFLNGSILGMSKKEIERKFDEIVAFAEVERFLDTPVKRYSSGMYVRLAFAVAAHLEPDILIVDEVLAVGDAEFQKKCLGKMQQVSGEGRTVIFVSHNMAAVKQLCNRAILLKSGAVVEAGETNTVLRTYLSEPTTISSTTNLLNDYKTRRGHGEVRFAEVTVNDGDFSIDPTSDVKIKLSVEVFQDVPSIYFMFSVLGSSDNLPITNCPLLPISETAVKAGAKISFELVIPGGIFRTGFFPLYLWIGKKGELAAENYHYDCIDSLFNLNFISTKDKSILGYEPLNPNGLINIDYTILNTRVK